MDLGSSQKKINSRLYGTATEKSDWDYIGIYNKKPEMKYPQLQPMEKNWESTLPLPPTMELFVFEKEDLNVALYSFEHFMILVKLPVSSLTTLIVGRTSNHDCRSVVVAKTTRNGNNFVVTNPDFD